LESAINSFPVRVTTPESVLEFKLKQNSSGRQLFNQVCNTIGLREVWFFGLRYVDSKNVEKWVKLDKKISPSSKSKDACMDFTFRVKYFPEEVSEELIQDVTQRLFYYEIKNSIISGQYYTSPDSALLLASYQAVVRHGKYDPAVHTKGFLNIPNYIPQHVLDQHTLTHEQWEDKIVQWYKQHSDLSKQDAIMEYLKVAQDLEMYGVTYFHIRNVKQTELWLGLLSPRIPSFWSESLVFDPSRHQVISLRHTLTSDTREQQTGFRPSRGCIDQFFTLRQVVELRYTHRRLTVMLLLDLQKAFDSVDRKALMGSFLPNGMP
uniref:FERM domain-containing protein n=1 Tax=Echinostoma caproni TaxID=27848 RepID=A0A183BC03_9TREM